MKKQITLSQAMQLCAAAKVVERLDHSIKVELPDDIAPPSLARAHTASIQVAGLATLDRTLWFGLICPRHVDGPCSANGGLCGGAILRGHAEPIVAVITSRPVELAHRFRRIGLDKLC